MSTLITILHAIVCLFLVLTILLQSGKGGGMGGAFGGSNAGTVFGGSGASTFLRKLTAGAAVIFMATSMVLAFIASHDSSDALEKFGNQQAQLAREKEEAKEKALQSGSAGSAQGSGTLTPLQPIGTQPGTATEPPAGSGMTPMEPAGSATTPPTTPAGSAATTPATGTTPKTDATKPAAATAPKTDATAPKTDATKPATAPKTDATKPATAPKTDATKTDATKTDATKPATAPKADATGSAKPADATPTSPKPTP